MNLSPSFFKLESWQFTGYKECNWGEGLESFFNKQQSDDILFSLCWSVLLGGLHTDRWEWVPVVLMLSVGVTGSGAGESIFSSSQEVN